ncbi:MAG: metalloregulator ArsR/SmtB family transcription factor [Nitrospirae bacterium]|nr:metalloregulator ArsR/SmtB family transcription factor [Nitrospirota bacterium]
MRDLLIIFKALSDETRLRIIKLLERGELCVCDIVAALDMVQPKVSFHLAALKDAGFIKDRKQGRWTHYSLDDSDFFKRSLLLSVMERTPAKAVALDREKLEDFLEGKPAKGDVVPMQSKKRCCGE